MRVEHESDIAVSSFCDEEEEADGAFEEDKQYASIGKLVMILNKN